MFQNDREQLGKTLADLEQKFHETTADLESLRSGLSEQTRQATARRLVVWLGNFLRLIQRSVLVQARARLEAVTVDSIDLKPGDAFDIALANRLDFMNGRAALVDRWRLIQTNADALQSVLDVTASGDIRTARNSPLSFRAPTGNLRMGLEFDAPFTRLLERNDYREALIEFQRSRRDFIQSRDSLHRGLRALLRQVQLDYYATRMRLSRELGIMVLDREGQWVETPLAGAGRDVAPSGGEPSLEQLPVLPNMPNDRIDPEDHVPPQPNGPPNVTDRSATHRTAGYPTRLRRLPPTGNTPDTDRYSLLQESD